MATPVISGVTRTNLGPLTTDTWTYSCTEVIQECPSCDVGWAAQTCTDGFVTDNMDCWPPRAATVPATNNALLGWGVYSPGIVCPGGYTSAATGVYGGPSDFKFQYPLTEGETAIGCCPEGGYSPIQDNYGYQTCVQFRPTTSFLVGTCGSEGPAYTPFAIGGLLNSTRYNSFSVSAPLFQVVYQESDLPAKPKSSFSISSNSSSSDSSSSQTNGPSTETSKSSGLSPGAMAGIVIGVVLGVIFLATAAFCLWRNKQKRTPAATSAPHWETNTQFKPLQAVDGGAYATAAYARDPIEMSNTPHSTPGGAMSSGHLQVGPNYPAELGEPVATQELESRYYR